MIIEATSSNPNTAIIVARCGQPGLNCRTLRIKIQLPAGAVLIRPCPFGAPAQTDVEGVLVIKDNLGALERALGSRIL